MVQCIITPYSRWLIPAFSEVWNRWEQFVLFSGVSSQSETSNPYWGFVSCEQFIFDNRSFQADFTSNDTDPTQVIDR